jgi:hypothetical protein
MGHLGLLRLSLALLPELVHQHCGGEHEGRQQQRPQIRPDPERHAQPAGQDHQAAADRRGHRGRHALGRGVRGHHRGPGEVADRGEKEEGREENASDKHQDIHQ